MKLGNNLTNFLAGGTRERELRETRAAWEDTQRCWRSSPLAKAAASDLALALVQEAITHADRRPTLPILIAACEAVEALYSAENIGDLEAKWPVIQTSIEAATEFRQMLERRKRWAIDFDTMNGAFRRILVHNLVLFFTQLPESCFVGDEALGDTFETPLLDLLDDPTVVVDQLLMLPYDDASFRLDIFHRLRERCVSNLLVASGFLPTDNPREHERKLIRPQQQKKKTGAELAQAYLTGNPLKAMLDVPVPFRIPDELRFEHCHIVGGTGHGKTQLMQKMIHADLLASQEDGRSVVVIDSQGDLINKLVRLELFSPDVAGSLSERLVIVDPADVEFPVALNLFDGHLDRVRRYSPADRERVLNGVVELYETFFGAFLGAELTQKQGVVFKYLARLMLSIPDATIHTLMQIMEDGKPFKRYMEALDGSARYFFETEFFHPAFAATKKQILRRLWGVLSTPAFERMFTQTRNEIDLFEAMNEGKIILVNTAKDLLKREGSQLLGRFFIAMIMQAALERSTLSEHLRRPAFVYVDEAQEYFDDSVETILNQARKYRVGITLAHQTLDQLSPRLRSAMLTNTSMKCVGGVSAKDARLLAEELRTTPEFIESMKRKGARSEFAVWVKHLTGRAIRLSVPLGFLESQATLYEEDFKQLLAANRARYCGTLAEVPKFALPARQIDDKPRQEIRETQIPEPAQQPPQPVEPQPLIGKPTAPAASPPAVVEPKVRVADHAFGKGGQRHRYLQRLIKDLAEQAGMRASIEAPLAAGDGQVDVLLERDGPVAAMEISVSTSVEHEIGNIRKCLRAGYPRVAVVSAKSKSLSARYLAQVLNGLTEEERPRVTALAPEQVPDFVASLVPPPEPSEEIVKGYKVRVSFNETAPEDARARRAALARIFSRSLNGEK